MPEIIITWLFLGILIIVLIAKLMGIVSRLYDLEEDVKLLNHIKHEQPPMIQRLLYKDIKKLKKRIKKLEEIILRNATK